MTSHWLFVIWGINLIGSLPIGVGGVKFFVVAINHLTKWVEAEPLKNIIAEKMVKFCYKNIVCHYGMPYKIISENGLQFDSP